MLPTPHGAVDAVLPAAAQDLTPVTSRPPDTVALLRVVEHLAEEPDEPDVAEQVAAEQVAAEQVAAEQVPAEQAPAEQAPADTVGPVAAALSDTRHTIDPLNQAERLFVAQQRSLIAELCPDPTDVAAVGALFDRVRDQWRRADDRPDPRPLGDAFGVALGDLVCDRAPDLGWATCRDRYGVEIVLAREDPEVLVYPIAAVRQAWETAAPGWFVAHLASVVRGVGPDPAPTGS